MPPDAQFPDKVKIEKEIVAPAPVQAKAPTPAAPEPEPVPEETVVAKEVADEAPAEEKTEETKQ
jgi:hypothetical protein